MILSLVSSTCLWIPELNGNKSWLEPEVSPIYSQSKQFLAAYIVARLPWLSSASLTPPATVARERAPTAAPPDP